jgi:hypothetical protein
VTRVFHAGKAVTLTENGPGTVLIAVGGQGSVYGDSRWCYKVYHDPTRSLPLAKIAELSVLNRPEFIKPEAPLTDAGGNLVGYAMRRVKNPESLPPLFTRSFRERKKITPGRIFDLVLKIRELVAFTHAHKILIVDMNELNFLVNAKIDTPYAIDVDSYQTPNFPADALMETVRDRHAKKVGGRLMWDEGTDWFSFAVLASQLMVGIHPYRGRHPDCQIPDAAERLEARMVRNLSIFNPKTTLPPPCYPVADIPPAYRNWLEAVLERGERTPAPASGTLAVPTMIPVVVKPAAVTASAAGALVFRDLADLPGTVAVVRAFSNNGAPPRLYALTDAGVLYGNPTGSWNRLGLVPPGEDHDLADTPDGTILVVRGDPASDEVVITAGSSEVYRAAGKAAVTPDGRVLILRRKHVLELSWLAGQTPIAGERVAANVLEGSATLYPGVVVQRLLDSWYATVFPAAGLAFQVKLAELGRSKVVEARHDGRVLVVVTLDSRTGQYDRLVYRFSADYADHVVRHVRNVVHAGIAFVALPKGVAVLLADDDTVEGFPIAPASPAADQLLNWSGGGKLHAGQPLTRCGNEIIGAAKGRVFRASTS